MNGVGFEILARTPVTKLPPSYLPPLPLKVLTVQFICTDVSFERKAQRCVTNSVYMGFTGKPTLQFDSFFLVI